MTTVVRPKRVREWDVDQSKHEHLPKVPLRMIVAGPSGTGKTQLIQAMILDFYRTKGGKSVFARVYVFSPISPRRPSLGARAQVLREGAGPGPEEGALPL